MIFRQQKKAYNHNTLVCCLIVMLCLVHSLNGKAQDKFTRRTRVPITANATDSATSKILSFPDHLFKKIDTRINNFDKLLTKRTDKALNRIIKHEEKLKKMMSKQESLATQNLFSRGMDSLKHFKQVINSKTQKLSNPSTLKGEYFPYLDTLKTSLSFLQNSNSLSFSSINTPTQLTKAFAKVKEAEAKLQYSEKIKSYLSNRQLELKQQLEHLAGYDRVKIEMAKISKEMYYYKQQLASYKDMLSEPDRLEAEATKLLLKIPAFHNYLAQNGALAALFTTKDATNLKGLQTRDMVNKLMKDQMSLLGPDGDKILDEQLQEARLEMDKLKQQAAGEGDVTIPGFKPNGQKTKSLWQHIEIGTDIQSTKGNSLLPATTDIGLSVAYHITKKGIIGIGGSWKIGTGKDILHVHITHEGIGLRSFLEYTIIKGFGIRGGWESNFLLKQISTENLILMKKPENWQQSALIGISKKMVIPLKLPVLKKKSATGSVQLLYDFLHESHVPATPALQLRVGMGL